MLRAFPIDPVVLAPALGLCAALVAACWIVGRMLGRDAPGSLWPVATALAVALCALFALEVFNLPIWNDEFEHVRSAWLISQGQVPYRDFWQHHPPGLWLALAPLVGALPQSVVALWGVRVLSLAAIGWSVVVAGVRTPPLIGQGLPRRRALVCAALLAACVPTAQLGPIVRAETLAGLLLVWGVVFGLKGLRGRGGAMLLSGLLVGGAVALTPKFVPLAVAWPLGVLLGASRAKARRQLGPLALWLAGCVAPVVALGAWLQCAGVLREALYWTFTFNQPQGGPARIGHLAAVLASLAPLAGLWGVGLRDLRARGSIPETRLMVALALGAAAGLLAAPIYWPYSAWALVLVLLPVGVRGLELVLDGPPAVTGRAVGATRPAAPLRPLMSVLALLALLSFGEVGLNLECLIIRGPGAFVRDSAEVQELIEEGQGRSVLAIVPAHPIYCRDATAIWHPWQLFRGGPEGPLHGQVLAAARALAAGVPDLVGAKAADKIIALAGDPVLATRWERQKRDAYHPVLDDRFWAKGLSSDGPSRTRPR